MESDLEKLSLASQKVPSPRKAVGGKKEKNPPKYLNGKGKNMT